MCTCFNCSLSSYFDATNFKADLITVFSSSVNTMSLKSFAGLLFVFISSLCFCSGSLIEVTFITSILSVFNSDTFVLVDVSLASVFTSVLTSVLTSVFTSVLTSLVSDAFLVFVFVVLTASALGRALLLAFAFDLTFLHSII